jgi:hypothetical protein
MASETLNSGSGLAGVMVSMSMSMVVMGGGIQGDVRACGHGGGCSRSGGRMIRDRGKGGNSHLTWVCTSFGLESKGVVPIITCKDASKFGALSRGDGAVLVAWF